MNARGMRAAGGDTGSNSNWPGILMGLALPPALWAALWGLSLVSDTTRVSSEVSASMRGDGVMVCHDGRIAYDKETLLGRLMVDGRFVCIDWRLRESPSIVR